MFCLYISLDSFPRIAGAIPLPSSALNLALRRRSPPCLNSALLLVTPALSLAQCQGWRRLCTKNTAGAARQIAPAKSGRESRRRGRNSAGDARKRAPAKCERQLGKHGGGQGHSEIEIAGALLCAAAIHRPAPALSFSLRRCSPHPAPAVFLRYACILPRSTPAPLPALCARSPQHYTGALPRATPALDFALRRRFRLSYAGALCWRQRYSICFVALPRPSPALFPTLCLHLGTPRPLERARAARV